MADKSIYLSEFKFNLVMRENMVRTHNKTWPNGFEMIVAKRWAKYLFYYVVRNLNTAEGYAEVVILIRKKLEKEGSRSLQRFLVVSFEYFRTSD